MKVTTQSVICQTAAGDKGPPYKLTKRGLATFKNVVKSKNYDVYRSLWEDLQDTNTFLSKHPVYYEKCRSVYTHKRELDNLVSAKLLKVDHELGESSVEGRGKRSSTDLKSVCFLCKKERDSKWDRLLTLVSTVYRQRSIHEKAKQLNDEAVLVRIGGHGDQCLDLIASDFWYHLRCMSKFISKSPKRCGRFISSRK